MTDDTKSLSPAAQKFILHWGEMGTRWGINRTVAQVHALLFLSAKPLAAEEIAQTLSVARSNVSTSLRELQGWRIVRGVSVFCDRRQHFEAMKDLNEMFRVILEERKARIRSDDRRGARMRSGIEEALGWRAKRTRASGWRSVRVHHSAEQSLRGIPEPFAVGDERPGQAARRFAEVVASVGRKGRATAFFNGP